MVEQYKEKHFLDLFLFLKVNRNSDFYYTKDNMRYFIKTEKDLKNFLKEVNNVYVVEDRGDIKGVIALWSSISNNGKRYFVKLNAENNSVSDKLLTVILWNFFKDLYIKIHKDSKFLSIFYNKGFKFAGFRGSNEREFLLYRQKTISYNINKKDEENSDEYINNKTKNKVFNRG